MLQTHKWACTHTPNALHTLFYVVFTDHGHGYGSWSDSLGVLSLDLLFLMVHLRRESFVLLLVGIGYLLLFLFFFSALQSHNVRIRGAEKKEKKNSKYKQYKRLSPEMLQNAQMEMYTYTIRATHTNMVHTSTLLCRVCCACGVCVELYMFISLCLIKTQFDLRFKSKT